MNSSKTQVAQAVMDSPVTTKAAIATAGLTTTDVLIFNYLPEILSITGAIVTIIAGVFLSIRHWSHHKTEKLQQEKLKLEVEALKRERDSDISRVRHTDAFVDDQVDPD